MKRLFYLTAVFASMAAAPGAVAMESASSFYGRYVWFSPKQEKLTADDAGCRAFLAARTPADPTFHDTLTIGAKRFDIAGSEDGFNPLKGDVTYKQATGEQIGFTILPELDEEESGPIDGVIARSGDIAIVITLRDQVLDETGKTGDRADHYCRLADG